MSDCTRRQTSREAASDPVALLRMTVDRLQGAGGGSAALDRLIAAALAAGAVHEVGGFAGRWARPAAWSTDLTQALCLVPGGHNFSLGHRDGVCWAWIAPNDAWEPAEHELPQDHPDGSGLAVAQTAALALTCAALILMTHARP